MNAELWVSVVLALISMVSGWGWLTNSRKYRQEVKSLEAENRQKYMDLAKEYVEEFRKNIAEPLQQEVRELRNEVKLLRDAVQEINDCPFNGDCPVRTKLSAPARPGYGSLGSVPAACRLRSEPTGDE